MVHSYRMIRRMRYGTKFYTAAPRRRRRSVERYQHSQESLRTLATRYGINQKTVAKWKRRSSVSDLPTGPTAEASTVLSIEDEAVVVAFRRHTLLPLDDCLYALQPTIPHLTRSSLHRCLQRKRRNTLFQSPNASGRSRQGEPVRTIPSTPSTNIRLSRPVEPFWSGRPMISGAIRSHAASLKTNRSITPKTTSQKAALNLICS